MARFNNPTRNVVFSSFSLLEGVLDQERTGITWISLADRDLNSMVKIITDAVKDVQVPKHIIVTSLQKFVGGVSIDKLKRAILDISKAAYDQDINKLVFSTAFFVPAHEKVWDAVALFNREVQLANEQLDMPRVNGHKAVMMPNSELDMTRRIRFTQWLERQLGTNVGSHLSYEGQVNHVRMLMTVFDRAFTTYNNRPVSREARLQQPMSLAVTPGYCDDLFMKQCLARKLIITRPIPEGERILECSNQRPEGWQDWEVYKKHGSLWRYWERMGILEAYIKTMRKGDEIPTWLISDVRVEEVDAVAEKEDESEDQVEDGIMDQQEDDDDDEIVFLEEVPAQARVIVDEQHDNSNEEPTRQVEVVEEESGATNNKRERDNNESEDLMERIEELTRKQEVIEEKMKAYQRQNENLEAKLAREKTTSKHWRSLVDIKQRECNEVLQKMENENKNTKDNLARVTREYEFLRNLYSSERKKHQRVKVTRRFAKDEDFESYGKDHK